MSEPGYHVTVVSLDADQITLEALAEACGLDLALVEQFVEFGLIEACEESGPRVLFDRSALFRVRSIERLRANMGVNLHGIALVLEMAERIRTLQREIDWLRNQL
jgi:hypothetical protein